MAELIGTPCPELVYPNGEDYDYVKVKLDPRSLIAAQTKLAEVQDPLLRLMLLHSLCVGNA